MNARFVKFVGLALTWWLVGALLVACQPIQPEVVKAQADTQAVLTESAVIDAVGPSTASDPAQAQAEDEFLAVALAKEQAFYAGDVEGHLSYYADDIISVWPETPEVLGKAALAEGMKPYMAANQVIGTLTIKRIWVSGDHATRQAEWEELVTPKAGGKAEHHIGRCTLTWEKIDGNWQVVSEYINYLVPPTEVE
jgi:ketosteroid isomerase-like protein